MTWSGIRLFWEGWISLVEIYSAEKGRNPSSEFRSRGGHAEHPRQISWCTSCRRLGNLKILKENMCIFVVVSKWFVLRSVGSSFHVMYSSGVLNIENIPVRSSSGCVECFTEIPWSTRNRLVQNRMRKGITRELSDHFWPFWWCVVGGDTFSPLAPVLGTEKKWPCHLLMFMGVSVMLNTWHVTFE